MASMRGPVDDALEGVADFIITHRGQRFSTLVETEQQRFKNEISKLEQFIFRIGLFATADTNLIEAVFDDILGGLRSHIGRLGWIRSAKWLLSMISRGLTPSGKLFVEIRVRIRKLDSVGIGNNPNEKTPEFDEEIKPFAFDDKFTRKTCSLKNHKKNQQINALVFCTRGCDLLLLQYLKFPEIIIKRILGLKRGTTANRIYDCAEAKRDRKSVV